MPVQFDEQTQPSQDFKVEVDDPKKMTPTPDMVYDFYMKHNIDLNEYGLGQTTPKQYEYLVEVQDMMSQCDYKDSNDVKAFMAHFKLQMNDIKAKVYAIYDASNSMDSNPDVKSACARYITELGKALGETININNFSIGELVKTTDEVCNKYLKDIESTIKPKTFAQQLQIIKQAKLPVGFMDMTEKVSLGINQVARIALKAIAAGDYKAVRQSVGVVFSKYAQFTMQFYKTLDKTLCKGIDLATEKISGAAKTLVSAISHLIKPNKTEESEKKTHENHDNTNASGYKSSNKAPDKNSKPKQGEMEK